jgi:hypothetical protein
MIEATSQILLRISFAEGAIESYKKLYPGEQRMGKLYIETIIQ